MDTEELEILEERVQFFQRIRKIVNEPILDNFIFELKEKIRIICLQWWMTRK